MHVRTVGSQHNLYDWMCLHVDNKGIAVLHGSSAAMVTPGRLAVALLPDRLS